MPLTKYVWDVVADTYLTETDGGNSTTAVYTSEPAEFGNLVSERRGSSTHWHQYDAAANTRALTDQSEVATDSFEYTAFGRIVSRTGSTPTPFRYGGEAAYYHDADLESFYVRRRTYSPSTARWTSQDLIPVEVDANLFKYVDNSPPNSQDPSGLIGPGDNHFNHRPLGGNCGFAMLNENDGNPLRPQQEAAWRTLAARFASRGRPGRSTARESISSPSQVANTINSTGCCNVEFYGHRGGTGNPGGVVTYVPRGVRKARQRKVLIFGNNSPLLGHIGDTLSDRCGRNHCRITVHACGHSGRGTTPTMRATDAAVVRAATKQLARKTKCTVCASAQTCSAIDAVKPHNDPCPTNICSSS